MLILLKYQLQHHSTNVSPQGTSKTVQKLLTMTTYQCIPCQQISDMLPKHTGQPDQVHILFGIKTLQQHVLFLPFMLDTYQSVSQPQQ